ASGCRRHSACLGDADHRGLAAALGGRDRAMDVPCAGDGNLDGLVVGWMCVLEAQPGIGRSAVQRTACLGMVAALAGGETAGERHRLARARANQRWAPGREGGWTP